VYAPGFRLARHLGGSERGAFGAQRARPTETKPSRDRASGMLLIDDHL